MTDSLVGPVRLFEVEPDRSAPFEVRDAQVRRVTTTGDLAAAVYAAAATAATTRRSAWLIAPDRWSVPITRNGNGWTVGTAPGAPIDAINRVLTHIPTAGETPT